MATRLFGSAVAGFAVDHLLVETREALAVQIYVCVELDSAAKSYRLSVAASGGADVERELASGHARSLNFCPDRIPWSYQVRDLLIACGLQGKTLRHAPDAIVGVCSAAVHADATLLEVNPLALLEDGTPIAIGVLMSVDESALHRHPEFAARALPHVDQLLRPLHPMGNGCRCAQ